MNAGRQTLDRRGMTLIELVLAVTILAIAGALVSGALVTALRSWQSGQRAGREELVARVVLERIATQLRSALPAHVRRENETEDAIAFDAGTDFVRFVTAGAGAAPTQVFYGLEEGAAGRQLVYREYPWPDKDFLGSGRPRREERVTEVSGFAVKVFKRPDDADPAQKGAVDEVGGAWSRLDQELPGRVELEIEVGAGEGAEPQTYAIAVPVLAREEKR